MLQERYEELQSGELKPKFEKVYATYFIQEEHEGQPLYRYKEAAIAKQKQTFGYFVLISSYKEDVWEMLSLYGNKELIEDGFHNLKDRLNMRRLRISSESGLNGKLFTQFIALILQSYIKREMENSGLNKDYTQESFLSTLNRIDILLHKEFGATIGESTVAQKLLYSKTGVTYPE